MSCLSAHHADTLLAPECRAKLHEYTARQLSDFRLNPVLVAACAADIVNSSCGALRLGGGQVPGCRLEPSPAPAPSLSPAPSPPSLTLILTPTPTPNPHPSPHPSPSPNPGQVLGCLLEREEQLSSAECRQHVAKMGRLVTAEAAFNTPLLHACAAAQLADPTPNPNPDPNPDPDPDLYPNP